MTSRDLRASLRRCWIQLTADRRRFGVLCATFGVGLLLWARLIIVSNVSRTAIADDGSAAATGASTAGSKTNRSAASPDKPSGAQRDGAATTGSTGIEVRLATDCERDPFVISPVYFPKPARAAEVKQEASKLPTEPAEDSTQLQARFIARLQELLGTVRLEAVMGNSMAVIGGFGYRVGDRLPPMGSERIEFTLVEVRPRSVVLEFDGQRFELAMSDPGKPGT
jgi:hypothetical protein